MLRVATILALSAASAFAAAFLDERMLLGSWQSLDGNWRITYSRDHTFSVAHRDAGRFVPSSLGRWRVDGTHLEARFTRRLSKASEVTDGTLWKRIVELGPKRFRLEGEDTYVKLK